MINNKINIFWISTLLAITFCIPSLILAQETESINCVTCDEKTNAKCLTNVAEIDSFTDCKTKKCFTEIGTDGKITRGCSAAEKTCKTPDCVECTSEKCNTNNICKTCTSSSDSKCAQTDAKDVKNEICPKADTKCLINVKDKQVERRCASEDDIKSCTNEKICKSCTEPVCNIGIFPINRRRCYQCASDSTKCINVANTENDIVSQPCLLYEENDECYTFATDDTHMQRGCISDAGNDNKCQTPASNELCATCSGDNCNNHLYKDNQSLKCIQCESKDDAKCMWGQTANLAKNCVKPIVYNQKEYCYTLGTNESVKRGCIWDADFKTVGDCKAENGCTTCNASDGCNNRDAADFTCIRCRSDADTQCRANADKLPGGGCRNSVTEETSGCFTGIWNNIVIRGCFVDADEKMQLVCKDEKNRQCTYCKDKNCNNVKFNGAANLRISMTAILGAILFIWWYNN